MTQRTRSTNATAAGTAVTQRLPGRESWRFEPGNMAALRHGAFSPRIVNPLALRFRDELLEVAPHLADERFAVPLWALCTTLAKYELLYPYVAKKAATEGLDRVPAYVLAVSGQAGARVIRYLDQCGLNPVARARLIRQGVDITARKQSTSSRHSPSPPALGDDPQ